MSGSERGDLEAASGPSLPGETNDQRLPTAAIIPETFISEPDQAYLELLQTRAADLVRSIHSGSYGSPAECAVVLAKVCVTHMKPLRVAVAKSD